MALDWLLVYNLWALEFPAWQIHRCIPEPRHAMLESLGWWHDLWWRSVFACLRTGWCQFDLWEAGDRAAKIVPQELRVTYLQEKPWVSRFGWASLGWQHFTMLSHHGWEMKPCPGDSSGREQLATCAWFLLTPLCAPFPSADFNQNAPAVVTGRMSRKALLRPPSPRKSLNLRVVLRIRSKTKTWVTLPFLMATKCPIVWHIIIYFTALFLLSIYLFW